jgi:dipeptidyl aminopeptidase/acylaminoacyl peptidase
VRRKILILTLTVLLCIPTLAAKRMMSIVELMNVKRPGTVRVSPDGRQLLFTLSENNWKENKSVSHIYRVDRDGSNQTLMTNGKDGESSPAWSPDGRQFAFVARRDPAKESQIFLQSSRGGEAIQLSDHKTSVAAIEWSPDGKFIFFTAPDPKSSEQEKREREKDDAYSFDHNFQQQHLWRIDVSAKKEERITSGDFSVGGYRLSRNGRLIAFEMAPTPLLEDSERGEIWVMDSEGKNRKQLTRNGVAENISDVSADGKSVLFSARANDQFETYFQSTLFLIPAEGGSPRLLLPDFKGEVSQARFSGDGRDIYFIATLGVHSEIFALDLKGQRIRQLSQGTNVFQAWDFNSAAKAVALISSNTTSPGEIFIGSEIDFKPSQVTHLFDLQNEYELPRTEAVRWKSSDGVEVEGVLTYPINYQKGRRYPLVSQIHGGPQSSDRLSFPFGAYPLAAIGYAVLRPNYRGSTGYGNDFLRDMVGHYFNNAHKDVMSGIDFLIAQGIADPDKLVIMGWSAGGHMTNWLVTQTDRFKAASSGAGAANWISMYAQSDVRSYRTPWFGGSPWQKDAPLQLYLDNSPIKYISQAKTPTLLFVGEKDVRVPMPQSVEMYRGLKANGVAAELIILPREPHGPRELRHQLFKISKELWWFEKYVNGRDYKFEKAPDSGESKKEEKTEP